MQTPKYTIQVLGTEFNVKAYHNSPLFETALIKGSVEITSPELSQSLRLKPDEIAVANNGRLETSHISVTTISSGKRAYFVLKMNRSKI